MIDHPCPVLVEQSNHIQINKSFFFDIEVFIFRNRVLSDSRIRWSCLSGEMCSAAPEFALLRRKFFLTFVNF